MARHRDKKNFYCEGCNSTNPPKLIPLSQLLKNYHWSRDQVKTLLRKKVIIGKKFKGRMFAAINPQIQENGLTISDYLSH